MSMRLLFVSIAAACLLAACGGDAPPQNAAAPRLLAAASTAAPAPLVFSGARADYAISANANGFTVVELGSGTATTVPRNARLRFADVSIALDLDGAAGRAYRLYRAAFDRVPDPAGIGFWIGVLDQGTDLAVIAGGFMNSAEFQARYGTGLSNANFVAQLYRNVLHREGEAGGQAFWTDVLDRGAATRAQVLAAFSESGEGQAAVRDAIANGIAFLEGGVTYLPRADPGPGRLIDLGRQVSLDGSGSTVAAGRTITYRWTLDRRPAGSNAVMSNANSARPSFVPDVEGEYTVGLVVGDGVALSRAAQVVLPAVWRPADGAVPASGNAVYLESEGGDPVGSGTSYTYTQANAVLGISPQGPQLNVNVQGDQAWWGSLAIPAALARLVPGYYGGLGSDTWSGNGGVSWWGNLGSCQDGATTWLVVDSATYDGDTLRSVDLRFSQRCQNSGGALHGRVRWSAGDTTQPPGPVNPPPAALWRPAAGTTPASGNYVYFESAEGDYIGQGQAVLLTEATYTFSVGADGAHVTVDIAPRDPTLESWWLGDFVGMSSLGRLVPGYYGNLQGYPFNNPARGGMDWSGDGRACPATGWFAVDNVSYVDEVLVALDLRFGQQCAGSAAALNGQVHWLAPGP